MLVWILGGACVVAYVALVWWWASRPPFPYRRWSEVPDDHWSRYGKKRRR